MPRNPQGLYTPPLPPVRAGELIESVWANTTVDDIASALTGSLPRNGTAPMTGPLILRNAPPTQPREAVSKQYLEQFLAYATGMPVGAVFAFASAVAPTGYLLCNGQAVSRTTYAALFAAIGTTFGSGDSATTFNVPDMRDWFVRGKGDSRTLGSTQTGAIQSHTHVVQDPGHSHTAAQAAHAHTTAGHSHGVNDPGHSHTLNTGTGLGGPQWTLAAETVTGSTPTGSSGTGISIQAVGGLSMDGQQPAVTVSGSVTGVAIGSTGDGETRPQNIALDYYIKAVDDAAQVTALTGISSSDVNMISINSTNPVVPELVVHANVPFGIPQLDANGKVLLSQVPISATSLLGFYDASTGLNPSQAHPTTDYTNSEFYIVSVGGNIQVRDPATGVESMTAVAVGGTLLYLEGQTQPDGWYYAVPVAADSAANISFLPEGTISATNVQAAIHELDTETQAALATKAPTSAGTAAGTSFTPTGSIAATNVQDAIVEVVNETASLSDVVPVMDGTASAGVGTAASRDDHRHPTDTSRAPVSAMTATGTSFTPSGSIAATNVQAAIQELDAEKAPLKLTAAGCAFSVRNSSASAPLNPGADNDLSGVPETTRFDFGSNEAGYAFTAPVDGVYQFTGLVSVNSSSVSLELAEAWLSTDQYTGSLIKEAIGAFPFKPLGGFSDITSTVSLTLFLSAGKIVKLGVRPLGGGTLTATTIMFSGSLVAAS